MADSNLNFFSNAKFIKCNPKIFFVCRLHESFIWNKFYPTIFISFIENRVCAKEKDLGYHKHKTKKIGNMNKKKRNRNNSEEE